ncbi:hypothetical protein [Caproiciproducens sp.]|uniref:hypothetical protein n=1 Tax=Caproiciproducens sp. TaxID=1954376 RepID=UPI00289CA8B2|nr:hypothetical protein [Caproiciproducens sp.]
MNLTAFKNSLIWNNIGEVAVVLGSKTLSVYQSALLRVVTLRRRVRSFTFQSVSPVII